jgi:hypothetical protein
MSLIDHPISRPTLDIPSPYLCMYLSIYLSIHLSIHPYCSRLEYRASVKRLFHFSFIILESR